MANKGSSRSAMNLVAMSLVIVILVLCLPAYSGLELFAKGSFVLLRMLILVFSWLLMILIGNSLIVPRTNQLQKPAIRWIAVVALVAANCLTLLAIITTAWIGHDVAHTCQTARAKRRTENCVAALTALVVDTNESYFARNQAIWALGQLGDATALPPLESVYTGEIPNREPLNETLSQYELQKAINLLRGGSNPLSVIWKPVFQIE